LLPISVIIDAVIAAALLIFILLGRSRGLFRSLMGLVAVIAALVIAGKAADFGTEIVVERILRPAAAEAMEQKVDEMVREEVITVSPLKEMEKVVDAIPNDFVREKARELLRELDLSAEPVTIYSPKETIKDLARQVLDGVMDTAVETLVHTVLQVIIFAVVLLLLRVAIGAVDLTLKLPVLRQVNRFFGLLFGAAEGVVLVCTAVLLLGRTGLWVTAETIEQSYLLKIVADWVGLTGTPV